jgi:uncharacterized membrane protein YhaH (DUF805 family)
MDPNAVIDVFRRNLTEHYFDVKGRVRRQEFWYFILASVVVSIAAAIIDMILGTAILRPLVGLALLLPTTGLGIRRLQDTGRKGTLVWVSAGLYAVMLVMTIVTALFITTTVYGPYGYNPYGAFAGAVMFAGLISLLGVASLVVAVILIYFWVQPGTIGDNQFGPDPKEVAPAPPLAA